MTKYVIISPVRDEAEYIQQTLRSVIAQTVKPAEWMLVNDGSSDETGRIVEHYAGQYEWMRVIHRRNRGYRKSGSGVIEAFYEGYERLRCRDFDFIVKLDGDLSFAPDYFERCFRHFDANARLGIGGGVLYHQHNGIMELEKHPAFHVRGATKIYKRACWEAIGNLLRMPGWDTLDEVKANMLGWETKSFLDLEVTHHRFTGAADGTWRNAVKFGRANYISGYHPLFMLVKCINRLFQKPYIIGAAGLFYGFVSGYITPISQVEDRAVIAYLRKQQLRKIFLQPSIWK
jgi:glycosyltransferase involved in cell wall biosynthesis